MSEYSDTSNAPEAPAAPEAATTEHASGADPAQPGAAASAKSEPSAPAAGGSSRPDKVDKASRKAATAKGEPKSKRPRRGRVTIEFARCSLGEILNVSPTGLRARFKGSSKNLPELEARLDMQVQTPDGPAFVRARVAWIRRVGLRKYDVGVHFVPADEQSAVKLRQLATMAGRSLVITEDTGGARMQAG